MSEYRAVFGIDPHARTTTVCAVDASTGEMAERVAGSRSLQATATSGGSWSRPPGTT